MTAKTLSAALCVVLLAGCGSDPALIDAPAPSATTTERVSISYATVALRDVSLPTYATRDEIVFGAGDGALSSSKDTLWADDPVRAVTLGLARALLDLTQARVAPEPWPYAERPQVVVDVRMEEFLPSELGSFTARGLYYVAPDDGIGRDHAHKFEQVVPFDPEAGVAGMAQARSQILSALALDIAKTALR